MPKSGSQFPNIDFKKGPKVTTGDFLRPSSDAAWCVDSKNIILSYEEFRFGPVVRYFMKIDLEKPISEGPDLTQTDRWSFLFAKYDAFHRKNDQKIQKSSF